MRARARIFFGGIALMALVGPFASQANNGVGDDGLRIPVTGFEVQPASMVFLAAVEGGIAAQVDPPNGFGPAARVDVITAGNEIALAMFGRTARDPESLVDYASMFGGDFRQAAGGLILTLSDLTIPAIQAQARVGYISPPTVTPAGTSHVAPGMTVSADTIALYSPILVCVWALYDAGGVGNVWTPPGSMTLLFQDISGGAAPVSIMCAYESITVAGATGTRTATSTASARAAVLSFLLMEGGVIQPDGTADGVDTFLADYARSFGGVAGGGVSMAELAASYPATFRKRGTVGPFPYYEARGVATIGHVSGGAAVSAFKDQSGFILGFLQGALSAADTNPTSRRSEFGTKYVNAQGEERGKGGPEFHMQAQIQPLRGNAKWYGAKVNIGATSFQYLPGGAVADAEFIDCDFESAGGTIILGDTTNRAKKVNFCRFRNDSSVFCANIVADIAEGNSFIGSPGAFIRASSNGQFRFRRNQFVGTPLRADVEILGAAGNSEFVGQRWSNTKDRFKKVAGTSTILKANANKEFVIFRVRAQNAGAPLSSIPVRYVDKELVQQFNVVTNAQGLITYDAAHRLDAIKVTDVYMTAGVIITDSLLPGILYVNDGPGANPAYAAQVIPIALANVDYGFGPQYEEEYFLTVELAPPSALPPPSPTDDVPYFEEADVAAMLEIEGQVVSVGGQDTKGILRRFTEEHLSGLWNVPILGTAIVVTIKTDSLSALAIGVTLGVDGDTYKVRETRQIGDGVLTEILLAEIP